ncbi:MAG: chloramphenicol phosphotransferase [Rhizobiales bacterium]|nr:chloramphenicol phosphotransferase [Hyphomicrobiales bacterium]
METRSRVVILNGVGSAGKGSIAKALQEIASRPFLHVEMDAFLAMLPEAYFTHPDGLIFETVMRDGQPCVDIATGPVAARLLRGMRRAVAALAAEGNDLIVDDVMLEDELEDYRRLLSDFDVSVVGVYAALDVLEAREKERGDRMPGLARRQFDRVHKGKTYDFTVDTSNATAMDCAKAIKAALRL